MILFYLPIDYRDGLNAKNIIIHSDDYQYLELRDKDLDDVDYFSIQIKRISREILTNDQEDSNTKSIIIDYARQAKPAKVEITKDLFLLKMMIN